MPDDMSSSIFRRIQLATFVFLGLVVAALVISAWLTLREQRRLMSAEQQLARMHQFEVVMLLSARRLVLAARGTGDVEGTRAELLHHVDELSTLAINPETPAKLQVFRARIIVAKDGKDFIGSFIGFQEVIETEHASDAQLIGQLERQTESQLRFELAAPLAILAVGVVLIPITRRRIIKPLNAFGRQLSSLAEGRFTPAPLDEVDPLLLPLHRNFNELVRRLQQLEAAHRERTASLEEEVRAATRTLLEQHRSLARAERLAATGELAASVAHELRNPLAGIQMTLSNLRAEIQDPELVERLDLVINELSRLTRLLNEIVDASRHAPEPLRTVDLAAVVDDMFTLTRYQLPPQVHLESQIPAGLACKLPQDRLRQALLNLLLNAAAVLSDRGGTVTVAAAREGNQIRIAVSDDGPGFPPELVQNGVRPFFSTRAGGTGLGLAMVRRLARDLGGTLTLANREPHGACVTLLLPAEMPQT
ncbi:MAG TPA: ATP-binding protein [Candidatus Margulisiibacteriota bacterium]|nr:ATP-binding protein [Candidatus Margulisiibacteriota bacterium]